MKVFRGFFYICISFIFIGLPYPSSAWIHSGVSLVGNAQLNLGTGDLTPQTCINLFHCTGIAFSGGATPAALSSNLFPNQNFSGTIGGTLGNGGTLPTTGPYTFAWDAGVSCFRVIYSGNTATVSNAVNATVSNGAGSGNPTITGGCGTAGSVTINWTTTTAPAYVFDGTYTSPGYSGNTAGKFYLIRQSDQTAYSNGVYWTPEMVAFIKTLSPESIRPMAWNLLLDSNGLNTNVVNWSYRKTLNSFSFVARSGDYPPGTRCGGITSFCTISVSNGALTAAAANDTSLSGWVDGEQLTGNVASSVSGLSVTGVVSNGGNCQLTVASTTGLTNGNPVLIEQVGGSTECNAQTTITSVDSATQFTIPIAFVHTYTSGGFVGYQTLSITGKSGGAKIIVSSLGVPIGANFGDTIATGNSTFTYNGTFDRVIYTQSGINNAIPIEAQVQLANLANVNFWYNYPGWANDTFVTSVSNTIFANLNRNLKLIEEYSNEVWNSHFPIFQWAAQIGAALNITTFNAGASLPYQSLRIRQIAGNLLPTTSWAGATSRLDRSYCFQAGAGGTAFATNPMQGSSLASFGYNTSPNRPIDFTDSICYAPYVGGGTALSGQSPDTGHTPSSADAPLLTTIVSDWNSSNTSGAISLIDQSIRGDYQSNLQTVTGSGTTFTTPLAHNFSQFDVLRFTVSGGTSYSGLSLTSVYQVLTVPTSNTFTVGQVVNGATGSAVNAGTAGSGTTSVGDLGPGSNGGNYTFLSIFSTMAAYFTKYQNMAANGFSPSPAGGAPKVRWYEGALEPTAPTTAQCSNIGINSTDCATIATALIGWKNDPSAAATIQYYYQTFMGTVAGTITSGAMPNSKAPAQLVLQGGGTYALNSNFAYCTSSFLTNCNSGNAAPYQLYSGFQSFSTP